MNTARRDSPDERFIQKMVDLFEMFEILKMLNGLLFEAHLESQKETQK